MAKKKTAAKPKKYEYKPSIYGDPVPKEAFDVLESLAKKLKLDSVWVIAHAPHDMHELRLPYHSIDSFVCEGFIENRSKFENKKVGLLLNSPGGNGRDAYRLSRFLQNCCSQFVAIIPRMAKSAATLIAIGADHIVLGRNGELGPLDVQIFDAEREEQISALDETQAVEAMENNAMETAETLMQMLKDRTQKKHKSLLPEVLKFSAEITKPMFEKIDAVRFSQMSRALREGEEMAGRLLRKKYGPRRSRLIASRLVGRYPDHGFIVDQDECENLEIEVSKSDNDTYKLLDIAYGFLSGFSPAASSGLRTIGQINAVEVKR